MELELEMELDMELESRVSRNAVRSSIVTTRHSSSMHAHRVKSPREGRLRSEKGERRAGRGERSRTDETWLGPAWW